VKSPLRENRTAGSVRGTSGNWCLYRDNWIISVRPKTTIFLGKMTFRIRLTDEESVFHANIGFTDFSPHLSK